MLVDCTKAFKPCRCSSLSTFTHYPVQKYPLTNPSTIPQYDGCRTPLQLPTVCAGVCLGKSRGYVRSRFKYGRCLQMSLLGGYSFLFCSCLCFNLLVCQWQPIQHGLRFCEFEVLTQIWDLHPKQMSVLMQSACLASVHSMTAA